MTELYSGEIPLKRCSGSVFQGSSVSKLRREAVIGKNGNEVAA
jgi:hypothetical protein